MLAVLREEYKNLFLYLLATLTGTITTFYQVLTKKVDFNMVFISLVGFIVATVILVLLREVRIKMDKDIKELEEIK